MKFKISFKDRLIFLGYRYRRVRRCPKLTYQQKQDIHAWCLANINNDFDYFIFIDESKIMVNQIKLYHMRKKTTRPDCIILNNYFKYKLNVWGGISKKGPTPFVTFDNNMNQFGCQEILLRYLWPFTHQKFQGRCYIHQDNDPKHRSRLCMRTCFKYGINVVFFCIFSVFSIQI